MNDMTRYNLQENPGVEKRLNEWFGNTRNILQVWKQDGTFFAVIETASGLYFARLWEMGGAVQVSMDEQIFKRGVK